MFLVLIFLSILVASIDGNPDVSLWDHVVKMEQVVLSVEYNGRHLNVWKDNNHGYNRYYVTPLCIIDVSSINCKSDEYSDEHRQVFSFKLKLWDSSASQIVQKALEQKQFPAKASDILPLPMQMVRLGIGSHGTSKMQIDHQWRSHQDQPNVIIFEIFTKHKHFCEKMVGIYFTFGSRLNCKIQRNVLGLKYVNLRNADDLLLNADSRQIEVNDSTTDLETFLARTKLFFEFSMVLQQQASMNLNISGKTIAKASFYSSLANKYSNNEGLTYLTSKDLNRLARDIMNVVSVDVEMTSTYISSEQENQIIKELLGIIPEQRIQSSELAKDEWNSVFWNDIFSRPDVQTEYFNDTLKYDEGEKRFHYDAARDHEFREKIHNKYNKQKGKSKSASGGFNYKEFGFNSSGSKVQTSIVNKENHTDKGMHLKDSMSLDELKKAIAKKHVNVKWTGTKFAPKPVTLYRINLKQLSSSSEIYFKRVVTSKIPTTQKIEIRPEILSATESGKSIGLLNYEDIINKLNKNVETFDAKIAEVKNQLSQMQNSFNELHAFAHYNVDLYIPKINQNTNNVGAVQNSVNGIQGHLNQLQQSFNDLNGYSRGHLENVVPLINSLNDFRNTWAGNLPNMQARINVHKQDFYAVMQCTDELSHRGQPVGCLREHGYVD